MVEVVNDNLEKNRHKHIALVNPTDIVGDIAETGNIFPTCYKSIYEKFLNEIGEKGILISQSVITYTIFNKPRVIIHTPITQISLGSSALDLVAAAVQSVHGELELLSIRNIAFPPFGWLEGKVIREEAINIIIAFFQEPEWDVSIYTKW